MGQLIYDVAASLDGYIAGPGNAEVDVVLGAGTALFADVSGAHTLLPASSVSHGNGVSTLGFTLDSGS